MTIKVCKKYDVQLMLYKLDYGYFDNPIEIKAHSEIRCFFYNINVYPILIKNCYLMLLLSCNVIIRTTEGKLKR